MVKEELLFSLKCHLGYNTWSTRTNGRFSHRVRSETPRWMKCRDRPSFVTSQIASLTHQQNVPRVAFQLELNKNLFDETFHSFAYEMKISTAFGIFLCRLHGELCNYENNHRKLFSSWVTTDWISHDYAERFPSDPPPSLPIHLNKTQIFFLKIISMSTDLHVIKRVDSSCDRICL